MQPEPMVKCTIVAAKLQQSTIINTLYELGLYHLIPHEKGELDIGSPLENAELLSELLVKVRHILSKLDAPVKKNIKPLNEKSFSTAQKGITKMYDNFVVCEEDIARLREEEKELDKIITALKFLEQTKIDINALRESSVLTYFFGTIKKVDGLEVSLKKLNNDLAFRRNKDHILVIGRKSRRDDIRGLLTQHGYDSIDIDMYGKDLIKEIHHLLQEMQKIKNDKEDVQERVRKITKELPVLAALEQQISEEIRKSELPLNFASTNSSFVASGWIPAKKQASTEKALLENTNNKVHLSFSKPDKKEEAPVKLKNSKLITPFEALLNLYDLPKYKEIDPTSLIFITFPLFFGFMLGDLGYGLVLAGVFYLLKKKVPAASQFASVLMFAALVSAVFGILFGEVFGFEHLSVETGRNLCQSTGICLPEHTIVSHGIEKTVADFPRILNRVHGHINVLGYEILSVLVIGAIVGFVHVNLAFLVGFYNELKSHGLWHAVAAKLSWLILEAGIILALFINVPIGIVLSLIGFTLLAVGEGVQGLVEIPALASNMLSYMRLGAVGLASVGLAVVVNENLAMPFIEKGGIFIVIGILVMFIGHTINMMLGVIGPFLHGIRLHYVEFFSKFFQGGGVEYEPFEKTTTEVK